MPNARSPVSVAATTRLKLLTKRRQMTNAFPGTLLAVQPSLGRGNGLRAEEYCPSSGSTASYRPETYFTYGNPTQNHCSELLVLFMIVAVDELLTKWGEREAFKICRRFFSCCCDSGM